MEHIDQNAAEKAILEACVKRLGFVEYGRIMPHSGTHSIEIDIQNLSKLTLTGLVVQPIDERLVSLELDARVLIKFDGMPPKGLATCIEEIQGVLNNIRVRP